MARLSQKDFMAKLNSIIGDRTDDEALSFIEDCKDTISDEKDDWKERYDTLMQEKEELDKSWRAKYKERFFSSVDNSTDDNHSNNTKTNPANTKDDTIDEEQEKLEQAQKIRFNDLFKPAE